LAYVAIISGEMVKMLNTKHQIPNTKIKSPNKSKYLNSKRFEHWYLVLWYCLGFRASDFGFPLLGVAISLAKFQILIFGFVQVLGFELCLTFELCHLAFCPDEIGI